MSCRRNEQGSVGGNLSAPRCPPSSPPRLGLDSAKCQHLPRLARGSGSPATATPPRTAVDRMNDLRQEDARRARNAERKSGSPSRTHSHLFELPEYITTSASARAGPLYYQANQRHTQERKEAETLERAKRQFAGPVVASWRRNDKVAGEQQSSSASLPSFEPEIRRRSTLAVRKYMGGNEDGRLTLLSDMALSCIASMLCNTTSSPPQEDDFMGQWADEPFPLHLKERLFALAGRRQHCRSMNEIGVRRLLLSEDQEQNKIGEPEADLNCEEGSWDQGDEFLGEAPRYISSMDLSYARIGFRLVEDILTRPGQMLQLRQLSLAGWGCQDEYQQATLHALFLSKDLMRVIGRLGNLEMISLARTRLYSASQEAAYQAASYWFQGDGDEKMKDTKSFLTQLSKSSLRLITLDLSECSWITGSELANLEWYSVSRTATRSTIIWTKLRRLILANCSPFTEPGKETTELRESPPFVGKWHAIHHGAATDSPYMLDHRPGLGNAIFRNDHRRVPHRRRNAAVPHENQLDAWNSEEENQEGVALDAAHSTSAPHSPSSSQYPTRCPVSRARVGRWEWERARLLDAVRGRWGSAIKGNVNSDTTQRGGSFVEVYF
jgi:hypothetical protein